MKTNIYVSTNYIYKVEEIGNEARPLRVTRPYKRGQLHQWELTNEEVFEDAGMFIRQQGGPAELLSRCQQVDNMAAWVEEYNTTAMEAHEKNHAIAMQREAEYEQRIKNDYNRLFAGEVTESNEESVGALLRYLNTQNWGGWDLPKMTIGYACHQYDCDGKRATTIKLDSPIVVSGEPGTMFEVGAPHGHLTKYRRI